MVSNVKPKAFFAIILILATSLSAGLSYWYAQSISAPSIGNRQDPGSANREWDYVIYQDGSSILAIDGQAGGNAFSSTSATTIWNNVIASGRSLFWKAGTYDFGGGVAIDGLTNVQLEGEFNQTIFKCSTAACVALTIGDQNDNTGNFATQFVTVRNIVFDGGYSAVANGAGMSIAAAKNVWIYGCVFQNAGELATGGFRVTTWDDPQALNENIYVSHSYFYQQKITVSGVIGGAISYSVFDGLAPGASGTKALVDFSKGDFTPIGANRVQNFQFVHNRISGWTLQIFLGFQAVNNATIAYNEVTGGNAFLKTVDVASPVLNGLNIIGNHYTAATGACIEIGYGNAIIITDNVFSVDLTPASGSTCIAVDDAAAPTANSQPTGVTILRNQVLKWGGVCLSIAFKRGLISENNLYNCNQANGNANSNAGILITVDALNILVSNNVIVSDVNSGAGQSRPITYSSAGKNLTITNNFLFYQADTGPGGGIFFSVGQDASVDIRYNFGYTTENQGATSVADGGTISHGLATAPTSVQCTTSIASQFCSITALAATTFTVAIKTDAGAAGTTQTIYWWALDWP